MDSDEIYVWLIDWLIDQLLIAVFYSFPATYLLTEAINNIHGTIVSQSVSFDLWKKVFVNEPSPIVQAN